MGCDNATGVYCTEGKSQCLECGAFKATAALFIALLLGFFVRMLRVAYYVRRHKKERPPRRRRRIVKASKQRARNLRRRLQERGKMHCFNYQIISLVPSEYDHELPKEPRKVVALFSLLLGYSVALRLLTEELRFFTATPSRFFLASIWPLSHVYGVASISPLPRLSFAS